MKKTTNHGESSIPVKNYNFQLVSTVYLDSKKIKRLTLKYGGLISAAVYLASFGVPFS